jgi:hypothetical protein
MRALVVILAGALCAAWTSAASAATYFKYRDMDTGCDIFVDRADRIPRQDRDGARIVPEAEANAARASSEACLAAAGMATNKAPMSGYRASGIGASISARGGRCLSQSEIDDLSTLSSPMAVAYLLAGLAALAAWIAVMMAAFRKGQMGWAILVLLLSAPMAFLYLIVGPVKDRGPFRALCALSILSPLLLFLANAWRLLAIVQSHV